MGRVQDLVDDVARITFFSTPSATSGEARTRIASIYCSNVSAKEVSTCIERLAGLVSDGTQFTPSDVLSALSQKMAKAAEKKG